MLNQNCLLDEKVLIILIHFNLKDFNFEISGDLKYPILPSRRQEFYHTDEVNSQGKYSKVCFVF